MAPFVRHQPVEVATEFTVVVDSVTSASIISRCAPAFAYHAYVQAPSDESSVPQPTTLIPSGWPPCTGSSISVLGAVVVSPSY